MSINAPKSRRLILLTAVYVAFPSVLILVALVGWMVAVENTTLVLQSVDSPDGRYRAQVVREDPGVSSNYKYMVRVSPANLTPFAQKLRLLPFGPEYTALEAHREPDKLALRWNGYRELAIDCEGCSGAVQGQEQWRDIRLAYEQK